MILCNDQPDRDYDEKRDESPDEVARPWQVHDAPRLSTGRINSAGAAAHPGPAAAKALLMWWNTPV